MNNWFLTVMETALLLGCDPQCLRSQARSNPDQLGFPVTIVGRRIRVPRVPFIEYIGMPQEELEARLMEARQKRDRAG